MGSIEELVAAVDAAFAETGRGLSGWRDPHPDRRPLEEEYSRVTNPQRWQILAARAEAWFEALAAAGLAEIEAEAEVAWQEPPRFPAARTIRAVPLAPGAIPLVVAMTSFEGVEWPAVAIGAGDPADVLEVVPDCACDACDSGSQDALDVLDEYVICVVTGTYRKLWRRRREITVYSDDGRMSWSGFDKRRVSLGRFVGGRFTASPAAITDDYYTTTNDGTRQLKLKRLNTLRRAIANKLGRGGSLRKQRKKIEKILARPKRWNQLHGSSWLDGNNQQ
ncbi:MAG: hypothetical protein KTV68_17665 [Acidimicrobiia bacterium]|nr:hypothetical protein [Acidimicrobiia bacterium]